MVLFCFLVCGKKEKKIEHNGERKDGVKTCFVGMKDRSGRSKA